jgi:hypothetical protein
VQIEDDVAGARDGRECPFSGNTARHHLFHADISCQREKVSETIGRRPDVAQWRGMLALHEVWLPIFQAHSSEPPLSAQRAARPLEHAHDYGQPQPRPGHAEFSEAVNRERVQEQNLLRLKPTQMDNPEASTASSSDSALRGWIDAAGCVTCIGALSLLYAIGNTRGAHPIAFILYAVLVSAIATLAVVGTGSQAMAIMLHPLSWAVGLGMILLEIFYYQTLAYVPPAHGNVMLRVATPIAMAAGWVLLRRRKPPLAIAGAVVIVGATAFVISLTPPDVRWPMATTGTLAAAFLVVRGFAAEFHPWNRSAQTVREKLRVTGLVILVTSALARTFHQSAEQGRFGVDRGS